MVQLPPAATGAAQPLTAAKSAGLVPLRATPETVSGAVPVLETVTCCAVEAVPTGTLPKASAAGSTEASGATPLPERATLRTGLATSLVAMARVPAAAPIAVGAKVTVTVQVAPGATVAQLFTWLKLAALPAARETLLTTRLPMPPLATVTVREAVVPTRRSPKARAAGVTDAAGGAYRVAVTHGEVAV